MADRIFPRGVQRGHLPPMEVEMAGIKESRQSCYKTTCLFDYFMLFSVSGQSNKLEFHELSLALNLLTRIIYFPNHSNRIDITNTLQKIYQLTNMPHFLLKILDIMRIE